MKRFRIRRCYRLILALALVLLVALSGSWLLGSQLTRPVNQAVRLPSDFPVKSVSIPGSGHSIAGWWLDQGDHSPVVLLLHPIRSNRSTMLSRARLLVRHGFSVLLIDLQAHGETPGEAITLGWRESADVTAAVEWLRQRAPARPLGVIGWSLGGASVLLAPQPAPFDAVVLEAVYPRVDGAVENRLRIRVGPLAPLFSPLLVNQLPLRLGVSPGELEPIRALPKLGAPVLIVAGSRDQHTTPAESEELYRAAAPPKRLWMLEGARHEDFLGYDPAGYERNVVGFLSEHLRPATPSKPAVTRSGDRSGRGGGRIGGSGGRRR
ncbi:MAG: alpha/beta hydrolase [Armatimonadota bacterium]